MTIRFDTPFTATITRAYRVGAAGATFRSYAAASLAADGAGDWGSNETVYETAVLVITPDAVVGTDDGIELILPVASAPVGKSQITVSEVNMYADYASYRQRKERTSSVSFITADDMGLVADFVESLGEIRDPVGSGLTALESRSVSVKTTPIPDTDDRIRVDITMRPELLLPVMSRIDSRFTPVLELVVKHDK